VWHIASPITQDGSEHQKEEDWNPQYVCNTKKTFNLTISTPTEYRILSQTKLRHDIHQPNGIAVLLSLWSYIFSLRFLELQK